MTISIRRSAFALPAIVTAVVAFSQLGWSQDASRSGDSGKGSPGFLRCREQEKFGSACACWRLFKEKNASAGAGESDFAQMRIAKCASTPAPATAATGAAPVFPPRTAEDNTCYNGFKFSGRPVADTEGLGKMCGAPAGMLKMTPMLQGEQDAKDPVEFYSVYLRADECYRFIAVGDSRVKDVVAGILDGSGKAVAKDSDKDPVKVVPPRDAYCPETSGVHKFALGIKEGSGRYAFQGWRRPKSATLQAAPKGQTSAQLDLAPATP